MTNRHATAPAVQNDATNSAHQDDFGITKTNLLKNIDFIFFDRIYRWRSGSREIIK